MSTIKRITCLAFSRQQGGHCIAGKSLENHGIGEWIRPISNREDEAVRTSECRYANSLGYRYPKVLDVMDIPLLKHNPRLHQRENWLLDPSKNWQKAGRVRWRDLENMTDPVTSLWSVGSPLQSRRNDRVHSDRLEKIQDSLRLIYVENLSLNVVTEPTHYGTMRKRVNGKFTHCDFSYRLWVTDNRYEKEYLSRPEGKYELGECFLTVSLGKEYQGFAYKLIAAVIERRKVN